MCRDLQVRGLRAGEGRPCPLVHPFPNARLYPAGARASRDESPSFLGDFLVAVLGARIATDLGRQQHSPVSGSGNAYVLLGWPRRLSFLPPGVL